MESQEAAASFFWKWWPKIEANQNRIITGAIVLVVLALILSFISWRHGQAQIEAGQALTGTLINMPQQPDATSVANAFLGVSADYPGTPAGQRALLQGAATLFSTGKYTDAQSYFQQYLDAHSDGDFAGEAALGVAKCLEAEGKLNESAGAYQHVINDIADSQAVMEARFSLGRVDMESHNYADAQRLFADVAQADPYGALGNEAAQYAFELRSKVPAKPAATTAPTTPAAAGQFKLN